MTNIKHSFAITFALAAVLLAGCQPTEQAAPSAASAPAPAQAKFTFLNAALAKQVPPSGEIEAIKTFAPNDTIQAVAILEGKEGNAQIKVEVLDKQGSKITEGTNSGAVVLKAAIPVELKAPQGEWGEGDYVAKFYLDGVPSWEVKFNIAK